MLVGYTETSKIELSTLNDFRYPFNLGTLQCWKPPTLEPFQPPWNLSNLGPAIRQPLQPSLGAPPNLDPSWSLAELESGPGLGRL